MDVTNLKRKSLLKLEALLPKNTDLHKFGLSYQIICQNCENKCLMHFVFIKISEACELLIQMTF